ncbi:MAG TPA: TetR/AcrR family transcriptional regulator [Spongiibacteraceae bacterium]|nr:TetR/AcrR family transcriptional regulator [Spongiibacteraceae bacterium]
MPKAAPEPRQQATAARLMDAAERLFAEHGLAAVSFRQLAREAEANVAAVHYHFGSKEALLEQVLLRRMVPLMAQRTALVRAALVTPTETLVEAWVRFLVQPLVDLIAREGVQGRAYVRLMWRSHSERPEWTEALSTAHAGNDARVFQRWLRDALPGLAAEQVQVRARLATRLTFDVLAGNLKANKLIPQLHQFLCAGVGAE